MSMRLRGGGCYHDCQCEITKTGDKNDNKLSVYNVTFVTRFFDFENQLLIFRRIDNKYLKITKTGDKSDNKPVWNNVTFVTRFAISIIYFLQHHIEHGEVLETTRRVFRGTHYAQRIDIVRSLC